MKNKYCISSIIIYCIMSCGPFLSLVYPSQEKNFEVFVQGKRYSSFYEYKVKRLKSSLKLDFLSSKFEDFNAFQEDVLKGYSEDNYDGVSIDTLVDILNELNPDNFEGIDANLADIKEMQGMLNDYNRYHKSDELIEIDPDKMKTIIIDPSEKIKADAN